MLYINADALRNLSKKTNNLALNQQTLWELISLFQLNKITFLDLSLEIVFAACIQNTLKSYPLTLIMKTAPSYTHI